MELTQAKTRSQLAAEYGVSRRTFYSWLKKAQFEFDRQLLIPKQVQMIYEQFGNPNPNREARPA